jgi:predicted DCC family thiol-disulfide oxidoreductase YuxK
MNALRIWPDDDVILYDGVCAFCSGWVHFVVRRDTARRFRFTPIQSPYGRRLAQAAGIDPDDPDTNAVIIDGEALRRSDGALAVLARLPNWNWVNGFRYVPRPVRDCLYRFIARNRYRIFGRYDTCDFNPAALAGRMITQAVPHSGFCDERKV